MVFNNDKGNPTFVVKLAKRMSMRHGHITGVLTFLSV